MDVTVGVFERVGPGPELAVLFVTPPHRDALGDVADVVRSRLAPVTLLGAAAVAVLGYRREVEQTPAVSLFAARLDPPAVPVRLHAERTGAAASCSAPRTTTQPWSLMRSAHRHWPECSAPANSVPSVAATPCTATPPPSPSSHRRPFVRCAQQAQLVSLKCPDLPARSAVCARRRAQTSKASPLVAVVADKIGAWRERPCVRPSVAAPAALWRFATCHALFTAAPFTGGHPCVILDSERAKPVSTKEGP